MDVTTLVSEVVTSRRDVNGGVGNEVTEEDPRWDLNPDMPAMLGLNHVVGGGEGARSLSLSHALLVILQFWIMWAGE